MARRYSTIKNIETNIASASALSVANNTIGDKKFVKDEATTYVWNGNSWVDTQLDFDLAISPEVLSIQIDANTAGHGHDWFWTWDQSTLPYARASIASSPEINVPLYEQGSYVIDNYAAYDLHDGMTQTHKFFLKWIDGAGTQNLVDWVDYSNAVAQTDGVNSNLSTNVQRLTVSVPSTISSPSLTAPNVTYNVSSNASGAYSFMGTAHGENVTLGPMYRGGTYTFSLDSISGHPFYLTTDNGTNFESGNYVDEYTDGVTGSRNTSGTLVFTVPDSAPDELYYQCGNHAPMRGAITVKDLEVETNVNGNFVIYGQHTQEGHKTKVELRPIPSLVNQMCLVYDAEQEKFVPQDLATYVENTPSFKNKIREVAGTATLVAPDGTSLVASVEIYNDSTYLPLVNNLNGDLAFSTDTEELYIWSSTKWIKAGANVSAAALDAVSSADSYLQLSQSGALTVSTGTKRWYAPADLTISNATVRVGTAPLGSTLDVSLNVNGLANNIISVASNTTVSSNTTSVSVSEGDYLTVDVLQIGSSTPGADLGLNITYRLN